MSVSTRRCIAGFSALGRLRESDRRNTWPHSSPNNSKRRTASMATREKHDQGQEGRERQEGLDGREGRRAGGLTSLVAWQRADDLFINLHQLTTKHFPDFERFELSSQLRRAAYSVPANIVEGFARRYRRSRLHFLNISESSFSEVGYCVHVAKRLNYITTETHDALE